MGQKAKELIQEAEKEGKERTWGYKEWTNKLEEGEDEDEYIQYIPRTEAMKIIGKSGNTAKRIRRESRAHVSAELDDEKEEGCKVRIAGAYDAVDKARSMVFDILRSDGKGRDIEWEDEDYVKVSLQESRRLIGRQGSTVKTIRDKTWAKVHVDQQQEGLTLVRMTGTIEAVEKARNMVNELLDGKRIDDVVADMEEGQWEWRPQRSSRYDDDRRGSWGGGRRDRYDDDRWH